MRRHQVYRPPTHTRRDSHARGNERPPMRAPRETTDDPRESGHLREAGFHVGPPPDNRIGILGHAGSSDSTPSNPLISGRSNSPRHSLQVIESTDRAGESLSARPRRFARFCTRCFSAGEGYPLTIVLKPPYSMRFTSKGIFFGIVPIAGSLITFLLTALRWAFDL